jgi:hypothetical protein
VRKSQSRNTRKGVRAIATLAAARPDAGERQMQLLKFKSSSMFCGGEGRTLALVALREDDIENVAPKG